jgi:hypothetical protein
MGRHLQYTAPLFKENTVMATFARSLSFQMIENYQNPTLENAKWSYWCMEGIASFRAVPRITLLGIVARWSREITEPNGERQGIW